VRRMGTFASRDTQGSVMCSTRPLQNVSPLTDAAGNQRRRHGTPDLTAPTRPPSARGSSA
jgi:hypothetical protein